MKSTKLIFISFLLLPLFFISCEETINNYDKSIIITDSLRWDNYDDLVKVVSDVPAGILTYSELEKIPRGTIMKLRVNREDFEVWEVYVVFDAVYRENNERLILCHTPSIFPIGSGDSGSPLLTTDGKVVGILCYGYSGNSNDFIARAVEDVLNIQNNNSSQSSNSALHDLVSPVFYVSGFNKQAAERYPSLNNLFKDFTIIKNEPINSSKQLYKTSNEITIPGSSISVSYITGDYITASAIGTLSFIKEELLFAFGHDFHPFTAAPTFLASTKSFIKSSNISFKMSEPTTQFIGSFVKNDFNGILINKFTTPQVADIQTNCSYKGKSVFSYNHKLSISPDIDFDKTLATDLSCYLIYLNALIPNNIQNKQLSANCNLEIITEKEIRKITFSVNGSGIDWAIYNYITSNVDLIIAENKIKSYSLSVELY